MRGFGPKTLGGQLILVMLLAVAASQFVTLAIYRSERARAVRGVLGDECLGRAVSAFRLAEGLPPERRAEALRAIETPLTRYWISSGPLPDPAAWQHDARKHLLGSTVSAHTPQSSLFGGEKLATETCAAQWEDLSGANWLFRHPIRRLDLPDWNGFGFATQLGGESWLNMVYAKPEILVRAGLTPGYYSALAVTVIIFALAAILIARRISRPMRRLAKAAEQLGRGQEFESIPEAGPSDLRATIAAFNGMQVRLRRFLEDRTRVLAAIGHDLRTPITSLRLRAEFIADPEMRDKFNATLDEMQTMAEAALAYARSESQSEPTRAVDICALLESISDDLADMGWKVEFAGNGRTPYPCRPGALRRAIRNVIENAVRYGGVALVSLDGAAGGGINIIVQDEGPGILEQDRERVFEPFVRLESSRNRNTGGAGLGLPIAREIARSHGGEIFIADSSIGLRVVIHLPAAGGI